MKSSLRLILLSALLASVNASQAAGSMLRIACGDDDMGAEVLVNGKFRGECPIDLEVPAGPLKLLVRKKVNGQRDQVLEQEVRMGEGSIKKIEVHLLLATLQKEAGAGDAKAMFELVRWYAYGVAGAPQDGAIAGKWLIKSAEAGSLGGMNWLGNVYLDPHGVVGGQGRISGFTQNPEEGLRWLRRAAALGDGDSMLDLGMAYEYGQGVPKNKEEAASWYRKALESKSRPQIITFAGEGLERLKRN